MKVSCKPGANEFDVSSWTASNPDTVVAFLRQQLDAARAIWPEKLEKFEIVEKGH